MIKAMYEDATMMARVNGKESKAFSVRVGVHQGSVFSPLLFIIVLEVLSNEFREGLHPWSCYTQRILFWLQKQRSC